MNKVTQIEAYNHYKNEYDIGSIYVWGFNDGTIISKKTIDEAYRDYHSDRYDRAYYDAKLKEGKGKNGSDCSGAHFLLSGYDTTADGYYKRCTKKGKIKTMPTDKAVLLFVWSDSSKRMVHTGAYLPYLGAFHMASSARNAVIEDVSKRGWTHWGYADFITDYDTYSFTPDFKPEPAPEPEPEPVYRKYTQDDFISDVCEILNASSAKEAFEKTITISTKTNSRHSLVTPLERYMKALEYYNGTIEADEGSCPLYGEGMCNAIKKYQKEIVKAKEKNQDGIISKKQATWKKLLGLS